MRLPPLPLLILTLLSAPAAAATPTPFAQIGGARPVKVAPEQANAAITLDMPADEARRRVDAYLSAQGFEPNDARNGATAMSYVRVADRDGFDALADCHGPAMGSPQLWLETLVVDLAPGPTGVQMRATGQFQVILKGLVSGAPFKLTCRSRGALEAQVRTAVAGK